MGLYVDGFVIPLPKKNLEAYKDMAKQGAKIWMKYGALGYYECVGDDLNTQNMGIGFSKMAKTKPDETVVFAFILYKSRAHRDRVNKKVMSDPSMGTAPDPMPFNMKKMAFGGFKTIVQK
jgi:uncharacterized protein YbaA (DUF1428 family)